MAVIDQGAILRSGAALIPDLQQQLAQQQQLDIQRQQANTASIGLQQRIMEDQREQATANAYAEDVRRIGMLPQAEQPQAIIALMQKYPKQSEALKRSYDAQDENVKAADFKAAAEVYSFVQNGAPEKAAALIRKRIDADKAAGLDTSDDEEMALALESGDPAKIQQAAAQIGWQLSTAAGPDKFASTYGALDGKKTEFERQYQYIKEQFGDAAAENFANNKIDPWVESNGKYGTNFYRSSEIPALGQAPPPQGQGGGSGGNASGGKGAPVADAGSIAKSLFPNIEITQQRRDPNSALGKANPKSWHNRTGAAIDVKPIQGMTFAQYVKRFADAGYTILEAKNEVGPGRSKWATGDHWHVVLGGGPKGASPVRVTSKAQYDKLAPGTTYIAPDGSRRTKS